MQNTQTIALGQIRPILGDVKTNVEKHLTYAAQAAEAGATAIIFPELGLTGYQVQDMTLDVARSLTHPDIQRLVDASQTIDIVFSFIEESPHHLFHIAAVYAAKGAVQHVHRKVYLPTYAMFDEGRYFAPGQTFQSAATAMGQVGLMVCEDAWHPTSPYLLGLQGATCLIIPSSSPSRSVSGTDEFGSQSFWRNLVDLYANLYGCHVIFVNRVGFEDGISFFGGSCVVSAEGKTLVTAPILEEALCYAELDVRAIRRARYATPIVRDEKPDFVARELSRILHGQPQGGLFR